MGSKGTYFIAEADQEDFVDGAAVPHYNGFYEELCGCCQDGSSCLLSFCLPCFQFGINAGALHRAQGQPDVDTHAVLCGALFFVTSLLKCQCLLGAYQRTQLREYAGIDGSFCGDACVHCFCLPCALAQESRELNRRFPRGLSRPSLSHPTLSITTIPASSSSSSSSSPPHHHHSPGFPDAMGDSSSSAPASAFPYDSPKMADIEMVSYPPPAAYDSEPLQAPAFLSSEPFSHPVVDSPQDPFSFHQAFDPSSGTSVTAIPFHDPSSRASSSPFYPAAEAPFFAPHS
ncbi:MAG: PLAC8 family protein [archaeon]|nr:PLAC8 family protein [archaeon]